MLSRNKVKLVRSLKLPKYRQKYHKIVVEGTKLVGEVIEERLGEVEFVCATQEWLDRFGNNFKFTGEVLTTSAVQMQEISSLSTTPEILAVVSPPDSRPHPGALEQQLCLFLDGVRDPGNMGAILRIADWFGFGDVFLSPDCVDPFNPKAIQASMGSVLRVRWDKADIAALGVREGLEVLVADTEGTPVTQFRGDFRGLLVLGNESQGVRPQARALSTKSVQIPPTFRIGAESLNVAMSAAVLCAHFRLYAPM